MGLHYWLSNAKTISEAGKKAQKNKILNTFSGIIIIVCTVAREFSR